MQALNLFFPEEYTLYNRQFWRNRLLYILLKENI